MKTEERSPINAADYDMQMDDVAGPIHLTHIKTGQALHFTNWRSFCDFLMSLESKPMLLPSQPPTEMILR